MSDAKQNIDVDVKKRSFWQNERVRRITIYAVALLVVFLLGLVPMWLKARERGRELAATKRTLRISQLQNSLANTAVDARRGEYEPARRAASEFFTELRTEIDLGSNSVFNQTQQNSLRPLLVNRDDTITLLSRSDPASAERLADLYVSYRKATGDADAR